MTYSVWAHKIVMANNLRGILPFFCHSFQSQHIFNNKQLPSERISNDKLLSEIVRTIIRLIILNSQLFHTKFYNLLNCFVLCVWVGDTGSWIHQLWRGAAIARAIQALFNSTRTWNTSIANKPRTSADSHGIYCLMLD